MKRILLLAPLTLLAACATLTAPTSASTLAAAEQAATLATQAADAYVTTAHPSTATVVQIKALSDTLHVAVMTLEADQMQGLPLDLTAFNVALTALTTATGAPTP